MSLKFVGARVVLPDDVVETEVVVEDGAIAEIGGGAADRTVDARGLILAPALIDVHGDAFERQLMPRPGVHFPTEAALLDTDRQLAANGFATAYHAVTLSWEPGLRSVANGAEVIDALERLAPRLTVENRVQLRWETFAFEAVDLIRRALDGPLTPSIAFNDHTSMTLRDRSKPLQERLFEYDPEFRATPLDDPAVAVSVESSAKRAGLSVPDYLSLLREVWARRPDAPGKIDEVAAMGRAAGAPMLSHDDTQHATREHFRERGARIAEFPMRAEVAQAARDAGDAIVFGAPNVVRGGSHIGSPSAADMAEDGLSDALASDYYYPAPLAAVARLVEDRRLALPKAWAQVSSGPAAAMSLGDRGRIAEGLRADLVLVDWPEGAAPAVRATYSAGRCAYWAEAA
ncbi:MAG: alpha-D-ribose 1-methylphosphonate 5-triphosphate diphosphatase [Pseudomonadota bacterium]